MNMAALNKKTTLILILILLLCIGLRLAAVATRSFWYDEAFSALYSEKTPADILAGTLSPGESSGAADIHPPSYYFLLHGWMLLFGNSILAVRGLSLLLGVGVVILVYFIVNELMDSKTALLSCLFVAVTPFQIQYSTETRMYALLAFCLTLAVLAYIKGRKNSTWGWWVLFSFAAAAAQYVHSLAVFFLIPLAMTSLVKWNKRLIRNTLLSGLGAILLYLPWLIHIPAQFENIQHVYWIARPTLASLINLLLRFVANYPLPAPWIVPGLVITMTCLWLAFFQTLRAVRQKTAETQACLWFAYLAFMPPLLLWLFSQWIPVYLDRALLASQMFFCLWFAWVIAKTSMPKGIRVVAVVLMITGTGMGLFQIYTNKGYRIDGLKALSSELTEEILPGDVVVHSNKLSYLSMFYYNEELPSVFVSDVPGSSTDTLAEATRRVLGVNDAPDLTTAVGEAQRIWFVIYQKSINEYVAAGYETHPHLEYLEENFDLVSSETYGEVLLFQFEQSGHE